MRFSPAFLQNICLVAFCYSMTKTTLWPPLAINISINVILSPLYSPKLKLTLKALFIGLGVRLVLDIRTQ